MSEYILTFIIKRLQLYLLLCTWHTLWQSHYTQWYMVHRCASLSVNSQCYIQECFIIFFSFYKAKLAPSGKFYFLLSCLAHCTFVIDYHRNAQFNPKPADIMHLPYLELSIILLISKWESWSASYIVRGQTAWMRILI